MAERKKWVEGSDYCLVDSLFVARHREELLAECAAGVAKFRSLFPGTNTTASTNAAERRRYSNHEGYRLYNVFGLCAPSVLFMGLFKELVSALAGIVKEREVYVQAWVNYQTREEVLGWHRHDGFDYHGYVAIDPKDTVTEFEGYTIENRCGLIYVGDCFPRHRVVNRSSYAGTRVTIGFDVLVPSRVSTDNLGLIPVLLR